MAQCEQASHVSLSVTSSYEALSEAAHEEDNLLPTSRPTTPPLPPVLKYQVVATPLRIAIALAVLISLTFLGVWIHTRRRLGQPSDYYDSLSFTGGKWRLPAAQPGALPFYPSRFDPLLPSRSIQRTQSVKAFSDTCAEEWIGRGRLCDTLQGRVAKPRIDVLWTWINGTDERMRTWRDAVSVQVGRVKKRQVGLQRRMPGAAVQKHFRDHDELRYSMRSVVSTFAPSDLGTFHLVVGDTPASLPTDPDCADYRFPHEAQVPHWLNMDIAKFGSAVVDGDARGAAFHVHSHSEIFKTAAYYDPEDQFATELTLNGSSLDEVELQEAERWRSRVVPSFNSLAIESQLANVEGVSDTVLTMNDDFFLMQNMSSTDVASPLSGPVFRLQRDLRVTGVAPKDTHDDPDGEWRGLGYTAWLLDQRFGKRSRPYIVHEGKSVSTPLLREVQEVFLDELTATAGARFRGKAPNEVQSAFLYIHYVIEKHRESLLASFFAARSDSNQDGRFGPRERAILLAELGFRDGILNANAPDRSTLSDLLPSYDFAGLARPKQTSFLFSSNDGYAHFERRSALGNVDSWPSWSVDNSSDDPIVCSIDVKTCFGDDFTAKRGDVSVQNVLRRVAFEQPACGDCIIIALIGKSGKQGFEAFLPPYSTRDTRASPSTKDPVEVLGLTTSHTEADLSFRWSSDFSAPLRQRAIRLIQRYSYVIGDSSSKFVSIQNAGTLRGALAAMEKSPSALVALNDDLSSMALGRTLNEVDKILHDWWELMLPNRTIWEAA